jgi:hypothetical protein
MVTFMAMRIMVRIVMAIWILVVTLFAVKDQEVHPKGIKRSHKNASEHSEVSEPSRRQVALCDGFNDAVFRVEA